MLFSNEKTNLKKAAFAFANYRGQAKKDVTKFPACQKLVSSNFIY